MTEQLWPDERIDAEYNKAADEYDERRILDQMRDELQARIVELAAQLDICECSLIEQSDLRLAAADALETTKDMLRAVAMPKATYNTLMAALAVMRDECGEWAEIDSARAWLRGQPLQGRQGHGAGETGAPIATDSES